MELPDSLRRSIYGRIIRLLGDRSQAWLAGEASKSGVGRVSKSTLSHQLTTRRFTIELLYAISPPLGTDVGYLIRGVPEEEAAITPEVALELVRRIEDDLRRARAGKIRAPAGAATSEADARRAEAARQARAAGRKGTRGVSG